MRLRVKNPFHKGHHISFVYAWQGIAYAFVSQPNLKIHFFMAFVAIILGLLFRLSILEWIGLMIVIFIVFISEMFNTAMEEAVNLATNEWKAEAKHAKDATAGAVLFAAACSVIVAALIFIPHLVTFFKTI